MKTSIILVSVIFMISCSKKDENITTNLDQLNGTWKWESTCGGFTGGCANSSSSNYATIEFSSNGNYIEKHNDTIYQQGSYNVIKSNATSGKLVLDNTVTRTISIDYNHIVINRGDLIDTYIKTK